MNDLILNELWDFLYHLNVHHVNRNGPKVFFSFELKQMNVKLIQSVTKGNGGSLQRFPTGGHP